MEKVAEYQAKRVPNIWIIDPRLELLSVYRDGTLFQVQADRIATNDSAIELTRAEIFRK